MAAERKLETARLLLRPPRPDDAPTLFEFMGDPEAMRFTHVQSSLEALRDYLVRHEAQRQKVGCAPWVVSEKAGGNVIGFGGLYEDPFDPGWGLETAYFFRPSAWGRGYASELVRYSIDEARRLALWPRLSAFSHPDNVASERVIVKAGFVRARFVPELNRWLHELDLACASGR